LNNCEPDIENKKARELIDGGIAYENLTVILGSEIEIYDEHCQGPIHVLAYLPTLETMIKFSAWLKKRMKNIHLSSQRIYETGRNVQNKVKELGGYSFLLMYLLLLKVCMVKGSFTL